MSTELLKKRLQFGEERYEKIEFCEKVAESYKKLFDSKWSCINAELSIKEIHSHILKEIEKVDVAGMPILPLWI